LKPRRFRRGFHQLKLHRPTVENGAKHGGAEPSGSDPWVRFNADGERCHAHELELFGQVEEACQERYDDDVEH
jgi:hypothetical protein